MSDCSEAGNHTNGRWRKQQHSKFLLGLQLYGKNWKKIEEVVGTRSGSQIRSHAQKFFLKVKKSVKNQDINSSYQESNDVQTVISKSNQDKEKSSSDFSYFFGEMYLKAQLSVKKKGDNIEQNFWNLFIDQKNSVSLCDQNLFTIRKSSFIGFDSSENSISYGIEQLKGQAH